MPRLVLLAILLVAPALSLGAIEPRTIDMTIQLKSEDGKPLKDTFQVTQNDPLCQTCDVLTLGHAISHALFAVLPQEQNVTPEQKWARGVLAERIRDNPRAELSAEEIALIKKVVGEAYGPLVVSEVFPIIDPSAPPPKLQ